MAAAEQKKGVNLSDIKGIAISVQRNIVVAWDRKSGRPYYPAILAADTRSTKHCATQESDPQKYEQLKSLSGQYMHPEAPVAKILWLKENVEAFEQGLKRETAMVGTLDSWLLWNLTGRNDFLTDVSNASSTMLLDLSTLQYSPELCNAFGLDEKFAVKFLPKVQPSSANFGKLSSSKLKGIPVCAVVCHSGSSLIGQGCLKRGTALSVYNEVSGTTMHTGTEPIVSANLQTTVVYQVSGKDAAFALESFGSSCGSAIHWLMKSGKLPSTTSDKPKPLVGALESMANDAGNSDTLVVVPAINGLRAPYWKDNARTIILGESNKVQDGHYVYSTLEGIAQQVEDTLEEAGKDLGERVEILHTDGEYSNINSLMQIQANVSGIRVCRPSTPECAALGAAVLASIELGIYRDIDEALHMSAVSGNAIEPFIENEEREKKRESWKNAAALCFLRAKFIAMKL